MPFLRPSDAITGFLCSSVHCRQIMAGARHSFLKTSNKQWAGSWGGGAIKYENAFMVGFQSVGVCVLEQTALGNTHR